MLTAKIFSKIFDFFKKLFSYIYILKKNQKVFFECIFYN